MKTETSIEFGRLGDNLYTGIEIHGLPIKERVVLRLTRHAYRRLEEEGVDVPALLHSIAVRGDTMPGDEQ